MFVEENSILDIVVYYKKIGLHYSAYPEPEFESLDEIQSKKDTYKKVTIKMKELNWGLYNDLHERAIVEDENGNRKFNYSKYKEVRLMRLITSWDATVMKDGKEIPVPVTEKNIKGLAPDIAEAIIEAYDKKVYVSEDEEGN